MKHWLASKIHFLVMSRVALHSAFNSNQQATATWANSQMFNQWLPRTQSPPSEDKPTAQRRSPNVSPLATLPSSLPRCEPHLTECGLSKERVRRGSRRTAGTAELRLTAGLRIRRCLRNALIQKCVTSLRDKFITESFKNTWILNGRLIKPWQNKTLTPVVGLTDFIVDASFQISHGRPTLLLLNFWIVVKYFIS